MRRLRCTKSRAKIVTKDVALCNGPSKLCMAFAITKDHLNKENLVTSSKVWIEEDDYSKKDDFSIVVTKRVGIDSYGPESSSKPYRFYILGSNCVSVRDRKAEEALV